MSERALMGTLLVTGLFMFSGLIFQLITGPRMREPDAQMRRRAHRVVGYSLVALSLLHLLLGVPNAMEAFFE